MITCRELYDFIHDYLSGELPAPEGARFEEHLAVCESCVNYLESYRKTVALGKRACLRDEDPVPPEVPEELVRAILDSRRRSG
ncbi:MAG TPA: zf-HC2 domain-containing protein [Planctomycetota bacterium]|nr:zf-HC2 domain-containing protein [Planctomycetota bacterium]